MGSGKKTAELKTFAQGLEYVRPNTFGVCLLGALSGGDNSQLNSLFGIALKRCSGVKKSSFQNSQELIRHIRGLPDNTVTDTLIILFDGDPASASLKATQLREAYRNVLTRYDSPALNIALARFLLSGTTYPAPLGIDAIVDIPAIVVASLGRRNRVVEGLLFKAHNTCWRTHHPLPSGSPLAGIEK